MSIEYNPMRSLIYIDCVKEDYRHKLQYWLYKTHIPESIAQFEPYVTKYAFYNALQVPKDGERFGTYNFQLTEHHWNINPINPMLRIKSVQESFTPEVLKWQGIIPDIDIPEGADIADADNARAAGGDFELPPFIFAFLPMWWEEDLKGERTTIEDGPNYRWQFLVKYPDAVESAVADKWMTEEVLATYAKMPEVKRILSSKVKQEINGCPYYRVVEIWFDCPSEWHKCAVEKSATIPKPDWAQIDEFPYLKPKHEFAGIFLADIATSNNLTQYRGFLPLR